MGKPMNVITDILDRMPHTQWPDEADEFLLPVIEQQPRPGEFVCSRCSRTGPVSAIAREWRSSPICIDCVTA